LFFFLATEHASSIGKVILTRKLLNFGCWLEKNVRGFACLVWHRYCKRKMLLLLFLSKNAGTLNSHSNNSSWIRMKKFTRRTIVQGVTLIIFRSPYPFFMQKFYMNNEIPHIFLLILYIYIYIYIYDPSISFSFWFGAFFNSFFFTSWLFFPFWFGIFRPNCMRKRLQFN
jgi:hypothetical protein